MKKCKECRCDLHAGKSWTEEHDGITYRVINLLCGNRKCTEYGKVVDTERSEQKNVEF